MISPRETRPFIIFVNKAIKKFICYLYLIFLHFKVHLITHQTTSENNKRTKGIDYLYLKSASGY